MSELRTEEASDDSDGVVSRLFAWRLVSLGSKDPEPHGGWHEDPSVLHRDRAIITALSQFSWWTANLAIAPHRARRALADGQTYQFQGLTVVPTNDGTAIANGTTS